MSLSSSFVFNWAHKQLKKIALLKGPGNWSKYRLFYFFSLMEGCPGEKNFYGFERELVLKQNIYFTFDGKK